MNLEFNSANSNKPTSFNPYIDNNTKKKPPGNQMSTLLIIDYIYCMKKILLAALLCSSYCVNACEKPYRMQVGAFFDSSSVVTFWSDFAQEISKHTKCPTNMHPAKSYKQHLIDTLNSKGDIFIVPTYYVPVLEQYGLKNVITTNALTQTYLVTKKQYDPHNLLTLRNTNIQLSSEYSGAYLIMSKKLRKLNLLSTVTFKFGSSFQSNAMSVIRGNMDAAVILSPAFDPLPDSIKSKVNYSTISESFNSGSIMVKTDSLKDLTKAIIASKDSIKLLTWIKAKKDSHHSELSKLFQLQVNEILKTSNTNNQTNK